MALPLPAGISAALAWAGFALLAAIPVMAGNSFVYHVAILVGIEGLLALSIHLMLRIGQLSLAQAGLMGLGAYASALLTRDLGAPFLVGLLAAVLVPALAAAAVGTVALRIRGVHFALLTFVLGEAIVLVFVEFVVPFGGNNGLMKIPAAAIGPFLLKARPAYYALVVAVLAGALLVCQRLLGGRSGEVIDGLLHNEPLVQSLGIDVLSWRRLIFSVAGGIAGAAGCLYAHYLSYISPEAFNVSTAVNALTMNVVGGVGVLAGPILGAVLLVPLPELFRSAVLYQQLLNGLALLGLMVFFRHGLAGLVRRRQP
ncbi:branched-chain amino acid ABC transporter permease [Xanthobacter oligotrophicus]|uniref:Branched-chain amino acid ABC transporter permease n=1 Tax=Xanthobacter oligotrophicus TaxID=2607286 RepID=A0ABW6ZU47_9HYPH